MKLKHLYFPCYTIFIVVNSYYNNLKNNLNVNLNWKEQLLGGGLCGAQIP